MRNKLLIVVLGGALATAVTVGVGSAAEASVGPAQMGQAVLLHPDPPPIIKG